MVRLPLTAMRSPAARRYKTLNWIELSKDAALHNVRLVQEQHPGFGVVPVLKANAYGHGIREMAQILRKANVPLVAVDGYFEAGKIRRLAGHRVLVLGYIRPKNVRLLDTRRCSFVVQDVAGLEAFARLHRRVRVHVELNTGMNRLGLQPHELQPYLDVLKLFPKLQLEGVMTHLADADNEVDTSFTQKQVEQFDGLVEHILSQGFRPRFIHIAQTAGSVKAQSKYANAIRLGIGLYGMNPLAESDTEYKELSGLRPVLALKSTVIKVISLEAGDRVSYNGTFTAKKPMRIGVLPLGYYEGVPRELSSVGVIMHGGVVLPIVGRVCMNHTMVDVLDSNVAVGDEVTVISADPKQPNSVSRLAIEHHLFPYTLLTGLSSSVRRVIV